MRQLPVSSAQVAAIIGALIVFSLPGCGRERKKSESEPPSLRTPTPAKEEHVTPTEVASPSTSPDPAMAETVTGPSTDRHPGPVQGQGIAHALAQADTLRQAGDFDGAVSVLNEIQGISGEEAAQVSAKIVELKNEKRQFLTLLFAVEQLASEDPDAAEIAAEKLLSAGDTARIALRKAVRESRDSVAVEAAGLLADAEDSGAVPDIIVRLLRSPGALEKAKLAGALSRLAPVSAPSAFVPLLSEKFFPANHEGAIVLAAVFRSACKADSNEFERVLGAGSFESLRSYVGEALERTNNPAVARWAAEQAALVNLFVPGIRGEYYAGTSFEKHVFDRIDDRVWVDDRKFPYPDGRQDDISIRWTGKLAIEKQGRYTFKIASDDGNRLWVDGKLLFDHWGSPANNEAAVDLSPGMHDIRIEFQQGGGGAWIRASWLGPDFAEKPLDSSALRALPVAPSN